jgi:hypothetical protein
VEHYYPLLDSLIEDSSKGVGEVEVKLSGYTGGETAEGAEDYRFSVEKGMEIIRAGFLYT